MVLRSRCKMKFYCFKWFWILTLKIYAIFLLEIEVKRVQFNVLMKIFMLQVWLWIIIAFLPGKLGRISCRIHYGAFSSHRKTEMLQWSELWVLAVFGKGASVPTTMTRQYGSSFSLLSSSPPSSFPSSPSSFCNFGLIKRKLSLVLNGSHFYGYIDCMMASDVT